MAAPMDSTELSVPLEVLERVLRLAFEPADPPSFTPAPSPPRGTSHLLLVSRAVRELCLPHFWRTVTVAQPSDWVTLFDKDTGLLAAGEQGRKRWEWVEELRVVVEAEIPVSMVPEKTTMYYPDNASLKVGLHQLGLPSFRRLPRLVMYHLCEGDEAKHLQWTTARVEDERIIGQLVMLLRPPEDSQYNIKMFRRYDHNGTMAIRPETPADHARRVVSGFWTLTSAQIKAARRDHLHRVLRSFQPFNLRMSVDSLASISRQIEGEYSRIVHPDLIEFCGDGGRDVSGASTLEVVEDIWSDSAQCRLVGYSEDDLETTERQMRKWGSSSRAADWSSNWSWTRADGSEFTIDFPAKNET